MGSRGAPCVVRTLSALQRKLSLVQGMYFRPICLLYNSKIESKESKKKEKIRNEFLKGSADGKGQMDQEAFCLK